MIKITLKFDLNSVALQDTSTFVDIQCHYFISQYVEVEFKITKIFIRNNPINCSFIILIIKNFNINYLNGIII